MKKKEKHGDEDGVDRKKRGEEGEEKGSVQKGDKVQNIDELFGVQCVYMVSPVRSDTRVHLSSTCDHFGKSTKAVVAHTVCRDCLRRLQKLQ